MANSGTTTDLIIRAQEIKTQPLDDLLKLLGQLTSALDNLASEGGPATKSLNELRSEAEKFETLTREISGRKALFETFRLAGEGAKLAAGLATAVVAAGGAVVAGVFFFDGDQRLSCRPFGVMP